MTKDDPTIFLSAGDDSGDLHAANVMRSIRETRPKVRFTGLGMDRMAEAGLEPLAEDGPSDSAMWLHNALRVGSFRARLNRCRKLFRENPPGLVMLVDFGGFNLYVARAAQQQNIPVLYYILPQVWAHGRYRLKKIRKWVDRPLVIYPFEPPIYRQYGVEAEYVGHPLFDELDRNGPGDEEVQRLRAVLGERTVALFPGSRRQEIKANLPIMLEAGTRLKGRFGDLSFAAVVPPAVRSLVEEMSAEAELEVLLPDARAVVLARCAEICLTKSGTITLEIASQHTPMVIFYRINPLLYFLGSGVKQTRYFGLINVLAGREICPERSMYRDEPDWVAERAGELLGDAGKHEQCRNEIRRAIAPIARPGASEAAARAAVDLLGDSR